MAQIAAHLVNLSPQYTVQQGVLSLQIPLGVLFSAQPHLLSKVMQVIHRAISIFLLKQAGLKRCDAQTGAITLLQRFVQQPISTVTCIVWYSMGSILVALNARLRNEIIPGSKKREQR
ncbi:hypothetical protein [Nitrosomonas sp. Nm33]|uniref:hypothetical protein n=1 Tax=Nitrosomonas sp. Nm33 TaxID=133724 RepID=UPI00089597BC|nr:hypothetical protein [Nitrosomonas sp. Nm33]SDY94858.1 hypothetical protein SAMN05421755_107010 [Nitrosomonas sp. Nm33]